MSDARRLVVVISSIEPGGAEGVAVRLCNAWAEANSSVTLVTLFNKPHRLELHPAIEHRNLASDSGNGPERPGAITGNLSRIAAIRNVIKAKSPDFVISHMDQTNVLVLLAGIGLRSSAIVVEHVDPRHHPIALKWSLLRFATYPLAARLVTVSNGLVGAYPAFFRSRTVAIPNPIVVPDLTAPLAAAEKSVVAMGRLTHQKGFDILIRAFAAVVRRHPDARLTIWGNGPERDSLVALAGQLGLAGRVQLAGFANEPFEAILQGSVFVLPSRYEGFGVALAEAMALGMPVVATDCPSGPGEIVRDGVDGLLVPPEDPDRLAGALCAVLEDPDLAKRLAGNARDVRDRFSLRCALDRWEDLFRGLHAVHRS